MAGSIRVGQTIDGDAFLLKAASLLRDTASTVAYHDGGTPSTATAFNDGVVALVTAAIGLDESAFEPVENFLRLLKETRVQ